MKITDLFRVLMRVTGQEKPQHERIVYVPTTTAGVRVNEDNALTYDAVWACVRIISETIASLSWHVMERLPNGGKQELGNNPVDWILNTQANPEMSAGTFRETMLAHALTWGNGYAEIERDGAGRPVWMWPLMPDRVCPKRDELGRLYYEVWPSQGPSTELDPRDVFHLKGLGFDGLVGYSVIRHAAQSIGLGLAMERNGAAFFGNGSRPSGVLTYPGKAGPDVRSETAKEWNRIHQGPDRAHRVAVLDQGLKWEALAIPNEDAQWLEGRKFQNTVIARWYRVPPHKIADLERATFSNIEEQSIEFVTDTILPWSVRLEQEANVKLFSGPRQGRLFTKINLKSMLRGKMAEQAQFIKDMMDRGVFTVNDALEFLDMNKIGADGDKRLVPLNMTTLEKAGEEPVEPSATIEPEETTDTEPVNRLNGKAMLS